MSYQSAGYGNGMAPYTPSGLERMVAYSSLSDSGAVHYSAEAQHEHVFYRGIVDRIDHLDLYGKLEHALYVLSKANPVEMEYAFVPDRFLMPNRAPQPFVGDAKDVEGAVKEAFFATMSEEFPADIRVAVLKKQEFDTEVSNSAVLGFSINRTEHGLISDVVVRAGEKDRVLLTVGHEIGHVLSRPLKSKHNEEAKAFAFSAAWMKAIKEHNIAGLGNAILLENPAQNGLHDVACGFVWRMITAGKEALGLYWELVKGVVVV